MWSFVFLGLLVLSAHTSRVEAQSSSRQCTGVRVGDVTTSSAIVWTRLTSVSKRTASNACPGAAGSIQLRYSKSSTLTAAVTVPAVTVGATTDFSHKFTIRGLAAATKFYYEVSTTSAAGVKHAPLRGKFETPPSPTTSTPITFVAMTCQRYTDLDNLAGYNIYPAMARLNPKFSVSLGDLVYLDNEAVGPEALSKSLARFHWQRMFSLPRLINFHRSFSGYFQKDDHDTLENDCHPKSGPRGTLRFSDGQALFREQMPVKAGVLYRTAAWGKDVQVWILESRDYRSPNYQADGPTKTLLGATQKAWLKRTLKASTATWKVVISPTPIVGPDKINMKPDNLVDAGFKTEGDEIRKFLAANFPKNLFIVTGDRHWQYHSVHPTLKLQEFSIGPASDAHAKGAPPFNPSFHKFFRVKGGFLSVTASSTAIAFKFHDVLGVVKYTYRAAKK